MLTVARNIDNVLSPLLAKNYTGQVVVTFHLSQGALRDNINVEYRETINLQDKKRIKK